MPYNAGRSGGRSFKISSYKLSRISLGQTINFIDNWIQLFEENYDKILVSYKEKMSD